mmetsp:Transcript_49565/g.111387  ORF Transcript_49565/g.111387 Transcript_49565/m.111387 type:complete len:83 (-) Transcript_49565:702-950(-)
MTTFGGTVCPRIALSASDQMHQWRPAPIAGKWRFTGYWQVPQLQHWRRLCFASMPSPSTQRRKAIQGPVGFVCRALFGTLCV